MKRLLVIGMLLAGFACAGLLASAVAADPGTTTGTTTTTPATTAPAPPTTTTPTTTTAPVTTAPAPTLPTGVRVAGVRVGGLSREDASAAVSDAFRRPLRVVVDRSTFVLQPPQVASAYVATAVARARIAPANAHVGLVVSVDGSALRAWVAKLASRFSATPVDAKLTFRNGRPHVTPEQPGIRLNRKALTLELIAQLRANSRLPIRVRTKTIEPQVTTASIGPSIVISRSTNRLVLYRGSTPVRTFPVATGQAIYPTPKGTFHIVVKERDPWWYPPTYDSWAQGLKPVPPGPNNPLGTRWMGLSVPGVGIHGTDEPTSIGYSESHGCIRMQVPDAEWLFDRVKVGTTVFIL